MIFAVCHTAALGLSAAQTPLAERFGIRSAVNFRLGTYNYIYGALFYEELAGSRHFYGHGVIACISIFVVNNIARDGISTHVFDFGAQVPHRLRSARRSIGIERRNGNAVAACHVVEARFGHGASYFDVFTLDEVAVDKAVTVAHLA